MMMETPDSDYFESTVLISHPHHPCVGKSQPQLFHCHANFSVQCKRAPRMTQDQHLYYCDQKQDFQEITVPTFRVLIAVPMRAAHVFISIALFLCGHC